MIPIEAIFVSFLPLLLVVYWKAQSDRLSSEVDIYSLAVEKKVIAGFILRSQFLRFSFLFTLGRGFGICVILLLS